MIARQVFAVGRQRAGSIRVAAFCAWGNHWKSFADELRHALGAPTSHGICEDCARQWRAEAEAELPRGGSAA